MKHYKFKNNFKKHKIPLVKFQALQIVIVIVIVTLMMSKKKIMNPNFKKSKIKKYL